MSKTWMAAIWFTLLFPLTCYAQTTQTKPSAEQKRSTNDNSVKTEQEEMRLTERRTYVTEQLITLADEARQYDDNSLRTHVLARVANSLWISDPVMSKSLFNRAWAAAEAADSQEQTSAAQDGPSFAILRRALGHDLRSEVIRLAASRDRGLGEEFLKKLTEADEKESSKSSNDASSKSSYDSLLGTEAATKRLETSLSLLNQGAVDQARSFAAPALNQVNQSSIYFLCAFRQKRASAADEAFSALLTAAEVNPDSDANTVSGLASYIFTPGSYITYSRTGAPMWAQTGTNFPPPDISSQLRQKFFQVAAQILLRPLPPADQDFSTSGRAGKFMVIKRLLPLFEQYAPNLGSLLSSQLASLANEVNPRIQNRHGLTNWKLQPPPKPDDAIRTMQEKLDHARSSNERDQIYQDAAIALSTQGDPRAREIAKQIDDSTLRDQLLQYVDFGAVQSAINAKRVDELIRLASVGELAHIQKVWTYVEAARLLTHDDRSRALTILDAAAAEARRIDTSDPDRARGLIAVATELVAPEPRQAWEMLGEAAKAANSAAEFDGENTEINAQVWTAEGPTIRHVTDHAFGLRVIFHALAKEDLESSIDMAKRFKDAKSRATAILIIADTILGSPAAAMQ